MTVPICYITHRLRCVLVFPWFSRFSLSLFFLHTPSSSLLTRTIRTRSLTTSPPPPRGTTELFSGTSWLAGRFPVGRGGGRRHRHTGAIHIYLHSVFVFGTLWFTVCDRSCLLLLLQSFRPHIHGWRRCCFRHLFRSLLFLFPCSPWAVT